MLTWATYLCMKISANILVMFMVSAVVMSELLIAKGVIYSHRSYMTPFIDLPATFRPVL